MNVYASAVFPFRIFFVFLFSIISTFYAMMYVKLVYANEQNRIKKKVRQHTGNHGEWVKNTKNQLNKTIKERRMKQPRISFHFNWMEKWREKNRNEENL